jgi:hypothetical protein
VSFQLCFIVAAELPSFAFLGRPTLICPTHVTLGNRSSSSSSSVHCLALDPQNIGLLPRTFPPPVAALEPPGRWAGVALSCPWMARQRGSARNKTMHRGRRWQSREGDNCKSTETGGGGGRVSVKRPHLSPWPLDVDPTSLTGVCIVCISGLVFTWHAPLHITHSLYTRYLSLFLDVAEKYIFYT